MQLTLLGIALVLLVVWLYLRRRGQKPSSQASAAPRDAGSTQYHAVSIRFDEGACDAAKAMSGRRFLASAAPRLPLPECDVLECRCRFTHHKDRRNGRDRRSPFGAGGFGGGATGSHEKERRENVGRREKDTDTDLY